MLVLILLCIINGMTSVPYREQQNNDMNRQLDKQKHLNLYDSIYTGISDNQPDKYNNDDYRDVYEHEHRRLFDWLKSMIRSNASNKTTPKYEDVVKERARFREIEKNLTNTLAKLSHVLNQILNIVKFSRQDDFRDLHDHLQIMFDKNKHITKRNADIGIETNGTKHSYENVTVDNKVQISNDTNGRRALMASKVLVTTDEVKGKLFNYIEEGFSEIRSKINSLKPVKDMFSKDLRYKIGYIVANIDTLNANMKNLKNNMAKDKYMWSDHKILSLYDTVKMSNRAVTNLQDVLKDYIENSVNSNY